MGPKTDFAARHEAYAVARDHYVWPQLTHAEIEAGVPVIFASGEGVLVRTVDGDEYIDLMSTVSRASTLGYGEKRIIDAVGHQLNRLHYGGTAKFQADVTIELAAKLAGIAPGDLEATYFVGSGSEANEAAIKFAHFYQRTCGGKPRAYKVIARWNAYHGAAGGAMAASDWLGVRIPAEPGYPGYSRVPAPTCYRFPFGVDEKSCGEICVDLLEQHILHEGPDLVSAVIVEAVMQANGVQIPPPGYLAKIREVCTRHNVLLIADEVVTGFGRTGEWFAVNHWDVKPDIMTMAKGLSAGYMPLGATMISRQIHESLDEFPDIHTYGGHPAATMAALTAIEIYESDGLIARAAEHGRTILDSLRPLEELEIVGQVRGLGMWAAIDFTSDPHTRAVPNPELLDFIVGRTRELGALVGRNGTAIEVAPPFIISDDDLESGLSMFEQAVREGEERRLTYSSGGGAVQ